MWIGLSRPLWPVALTVAMAAVGCAPEHVSAVYDSNTRSAIRLDDDVDLDGRIDLRTYFQHGHAVRLEADVNGDGQVDRWEYYDAAGRLLEVGRSSVSDSREDTWVSQDGDQLRVDQSTQRDGTRDRHETYRADVLVKAEIDTNRDGAIDQWQEFADGRLRELRVDSRQRLGRPDRKLVYAADGSLEKVEADPDGDGRFGPLEASDGPR